MTSLLIKWSKTAQHSNSIVFMTMTYYGITLYSATILNPIETTNFLHQIVTEKLPKAKQKLSSQSKESTNKSDKTNVPKSGKDKPSKTGKKGSSTGKKKGTKTNRWPYQEKLPPLLESMKLDIKELANLECRSQYQISSVKIENEQARDNEVFRMFWAMMNQDAGFMWQWIKVYVLTHRKFSQLAKDYFRSKGLSIQIWLNGLKQGRRPDVLGLFLLCLVTQIHCFVHLKGGYWTSLKDVPNSHLEFM